MPFTKGQPEDLSNLRDMAYGWGKIVSRRAFGDEGPGLDIDFDSIESLAVDIGQAVIKGAIEETLKTQLKILGDCQPCPQCARACPLDTESRTIQVRGGTIEYAEPLVIARHVAGIFFPLRRACGSTRTTSLRRSLVRSPRRRAKHFLRRRRGISR